MTVSSAANKVIALGNSASTSFSYSFFVPGQSASDQTNFLVVVTDSSGNQTTLTNSQYSVVNSNVYGTSSPGGVVTYPTTGSPLATGSTITIARVLPFTQLVSIENQGGFYPSSVDQMGDFLEMQIQQLNEQQGRVVMAPIVDRSPIANLPAAAQRANQAMGFDSNGNPIAISTLPAGTVSTAMQPVVNAASLAAGRTAFGLGGMAVEGIGKGLQDDGSGNARVVFPTSAVATAQSVGLSNYLTQYIVGGTLTFTLAKASTLFSGFGFWVYAASGDGALSPNASDTIQTGSSGSSFTIGQGGQAWVTTDGISQWQVFYAGSPMILREISTPATPPASGTLLFYAKSNNALAVQGSGGVEQVLGLALPSASGLSITNNSGTPNTQITAIVGQAVVTNSSGLGIFYSGGTLTINLATTGANGLDTGSIAASTFYHVFIIYNGTTFAGLASTSATSPSLPSGYTYSMRIGTMQTDGSSHLRKTYQTGRRVKFSSSAPTIGTGTITYATFFPSTSEAALIQGITSTVTNDTWSISDMDGIVVAAQGALPSGSGEVVTAIGTVQNSGGTTFTASGTGATFTAYGWLDRVNAT
jgi:hypothetical protein